jgi:hypothetical protein
MCFTRGMLSVSLQTGPVVVIGDLVGSRDAPDRAELHRQLLAALAVANEHAAPTVPLAPTVGDEFQGVFGRAVDALRATLLVRASMSEPHDVRFGIGVGEVFAVGETGPGFPRQDGPGWWAARDAIDYVASGGFRRGVPGTLRTWIRGADTADPEVRALNAHLATRDHLVSEMDDRDRRILRGLLLRRTATEVAQEEGVSVSAVSQRTQRSGAAAVAFALDALEGRL